MIDRPKIYQHVQIRMGNAKLFMHMHHYAEIEGQEIPLSCGYRNLGS